MAGADYPIVAILIISVLVGFARGFIREAIALAAWIIGVWVAWKFPQLLFPYLGGALAEHPAKLWAARTLIVVTALLLGALVGAVVSWTVRSAVVLATVDRIVGVLFGVVRGVLIVGVLVVVGQALRLDGEGWWKRSKLLPYAGLVAGSLEGLGRKAGIEADAVVPGRAGD